MRSFTARTEDARAPCRSWTTSASRPPYSVVAGEARTAAFLDVCAMDLPGKMTLGLPEGCGRQPGIRTAGRDLSTTCARECVLEPLRHARRISAPMPSNALASLLIGLLCFIWGSTWFVIRIGLRDLPPFQSAAVRFMVAALLM